MNWDQIEGKWKQNTGKIKEKWGKLTDDDLTVIHGKRDQLVGKVQERYGIAKEEAEKQVNEFVKAFREEHQQEVGSDTETEEMERDAHSGSKNKARRAGQS
jgi:uncharacterized protein YjbJ (UPF0337 family)